jgi:phosphatidate cytidylyltransferase
MILKQRFITGALAGAGFLFTLYLGGYWYSSLLLLMALVGFYEFSRIHQFKHWHISTMLGYMAVFLLVWPWTYMELNMISFEKIAWFWLLLFLTVTVGTKNKMNIEKVSVLFAGMIYIGLGFHYMSVTIWMEHGLFWTLLVFACIWITDIGAYFTGSAFGKRLLWPSISPKKTVEGAIGGIILSVAAAIGFSLYSPELLNIYNAVLLGLAVSITGQIGDFIESAYKRTKGVKDSGNILPGHGGVLDRVDSWIIVFPFVHFMGLLPI